MNYMKYIYSVLISLVLFSCVHKDFCIENEELDMSVKVVINWPEGTVIPANMRVFFYPKNNANGNTQHFMFDFPGTGGEVKLPLGEYSIVAYNYSDNGNFLGVDEISFETIKLKTDQTKWRGASLYGDLNGKNVYETPEMAYSASKDYQVIPNKSGTTQVIELDAAPAVCHFTYEVNGMKGLEYISEFKGVLSKVSSHVRIGSDKLDGEESFVVFDGNADEAKNRITGEYNIFGNVPEARQIQFIMYIRLKDGNIISKTVDVTAQIEKVPLKGNIRNVHLIIDGDIDLTDHLIPQPGGFDFKVEGWESVIEVDLEM
jgi:hypothetical protein